MRAILLVDGVDLAPVYPVTAADLAGAATPVVVVLMAGLAVSGVPVQVRSVEAVMP